MNNREVLRRIVDVVHSLGYDVCICDDEVFIIVPRRFRDVWESASIKAEIEELASCSIYGCGINLFIMDKEEWEIMKSWCYG